MKFTYKGYSKAGAPVTDVAEGADRAEVMETLRRRGVFVTEVVEGGRAENTQHAHVKRKGFKLNGRGQRLEAVAVFMRQLSLLVSTGTPLVEAMHSLERQTSQGPFREVILAIRTHVEEGSQLSEALAAHPEYFDAVCRSLIAAGEQGGKLDVMLDRLARLIRQQVKVRKTVKGAMIYPALLICVAIVVVTAMLGFVLPRFEGLFKTLDTPLPPTTKVLMSMSAMLRSYWWGIAGGLAVAGVGLKFWLASAGGSAAWDYFVVKAPQLGNVSRSFATARIARMLGTLLDGKVALLEALGLTRQSMTNSHYVALLTRAEEAVIRGENMSSALADPKLIHPSVCEALRSGERTGQIGPVLVSVAEYLDEDNEGLIKTLTGLMEPIILICLGLVVGMVAISMFLPLFDLTSATGGGPGGAK